MHDRVHRAGRSSHADPSGRDGPPGGRCVECCRGTHRSRDRTRPGCRHDGCRHVTGLLGNARPGASRLDTACPGVGRRGVDHHRPRQPGPRPGMTGPWDRCGLRVQSCGGCHVVLRRLGCVACVLEQHARRPSTSSWGCRPPCTTWPYGVACCWAWESSGDERLRTAAAARGRGKGT